MKPRKDRCLADGEVTGHAHRVTAKTAKVFGDGVERELVAPRGTSVVHEEHKRITLPPGDYDVTRQREVDPDTEEIRSVAD